jgi:hypothetical protein
MKSKTNISMASRMLHLAVCLDSPLLVAVRITRALEDFSFLDLLEDRHRDSPVFAFATMLHSLTLATL